MAAAGGIRHRREPPPFRHVTVLGVERLGPRMVRVTFGGPDLAALVPEQPAASVRLLLPSGSRQEPVIPEWNGNEFLLPDGRRPIIRTFTPRRVTAGPDGLDLEIVVHGAGASSSWAGGAEEGAIAAISGPGRGYVIDPVAPAFLLAGDETAIPAASQLLESLPRETPVEIHLEVAEPEGRLLLPDHPHALVEWHDLQPGAPPGDALVAAVRGANLEPATRVWVAGEAAAVQRIRRYLFAERGLSRGHATVRGYWKHGRAGAGDDG